MDGCLILSSCRIIGSSEAGFLVTAKFELKHVNTKLNLISLFSNVAKERACLMVPQNTHTVGDALNEIDE